MRTILPAWFDPVEESFLVQRSSVNSCSATENINETRAFCVLILFLHVSHVYKLIFSKEHFSFTGAVWHSE